MKDAERLRDTADNYHNAWKEYKSLIEYLSVAAEKGKYTVNFIGVQFNDITIGRLQENGFFVKCYQVKCGDKKQNNVMVSWKETL